MDMKAYSAKVYIKPDDLGDGHLDETIAEIEIGKFERPVATFETGHLLTLNKSNVSALRRAFGDDSETWIGQKVELRRGKTKYQGTMKDTVVVTPVMNGAPFDEAIP